MDNLEKLLFLRDKELYILTSYARITIQKDIRIILLFNLELAKINILATNILGKFTRLKWWEEQLDKIYKLIEEYKIEEESNKRNKLLVKHNLLENKYKKQFIGLSYDLFQVILDYSIPQSYFIEILKYRYKDFEESIVFSIEELQDYINKTNGNILRIIEIIQRKHNKQLDIFYKNNKESIENIIYNMAIIIKYNNILRGLNINNIKDNPFITESWLKKAKAISIGRTILETDKKEEKTLYKSLQLVILRESKELVKYIKEKTKKNKFFNMYKFFLLYFIQQSYFQKKLEEQDFNIKRVSLLMQGFYINIRLFLAKIFL